MIKKNRDTTDILFVDENKKEKLVKLDDVIANDYNLSCSSYIHNEIAKVTYNPLILEQQAQNSFIKRLRSELNFTLAVSKMEKQDTLISLFIKKIELVLKEFKTLKNIETQIQNNECLF